MSSAPADALRCEAVLADGSSCAALAEPLFLQLAGPGGGVVSLTLDYATSAEAGQPVAVEVWADRATRTLVFAHGRVAAEAGGTVARLSAVLRRGA